MKKGLLLAMLALQCAGTMVQAGIKFGSRQAGFVVSSGTLAAGTNKLTLTDGMVRNTGGTVTGTFTCDGANIEIDNASTHTKFRTDGVYDPDSSNKITLDATGDVLRMDGGETPGAVTIGKSSASVTARIVGHGDFGGVITIGTMTGTNDIDATLEMDFQNPISQNIVFDAGIGEDNVGNTATLKLLNDLQLADGIELETTSTTNSKAKAVINGNNRVFSFGGTDLTLSNTQAEIEWQDASIELNAKLTLGSGSTEKGWNFTSGAIINGNANELAINASTTTVLTAASDLMLTDIDVTGLQSGNLSTTGTLYLRDASLKDSAGNGHFRVVGQAAISSTNGDLFGVTSSSGAVTWGSVAAIELLDDLTFGEHGKWTLGGAMTVFGNGKTVDLQAQDGAGEGIIMQHYPLYLNNVSLVGLTDNSLSNTSSEADLYCSDVMFADTSGNALRITGDLEGAAQDPAQVSLTTQKTFVSGDVTFDSGAVVELLSTVTLGSGVVWTFNDNATIIGNGNILDLRGASSAGISVASGKTLKIRSALVMIDDSTLATGISGTLDLSDVTLVVSADADWSSSSGIIDVTGATTIVTGGYTFTPPSSSTVSNATLWYDTMTAPNTNNIVEANWTTGNAGRIAHAVQGDTNIGDVTMSSSSNEISDSFFLYPNDTANLLGRYAIFDTTSTFTVDGHGRSLILGDTSNVTAAEGQLMSVQGANKVKLTHIVLDGVDSSHFVSNSTAGASLFEFCNGTQLKLKADDTLSTSYAFVDNGEADSQMVLDLNGKTLDLGVHCFDINLAHTGSVMTIKNGRLKGVTRTKLGGAATSHVGTVVLQDVVVELDDLHLTKDGALTLDNGNWKIAGDTQFVLGGTSLAATVELKNATIATSMTIAQGARMTVGIGVTYIHSETAADTFVMESDSSTLFLDGGNFTSSAGSQTMKNGRLIIDHISAFDATGQTLTLGDGTDALDIHLMPGAQIKAVGGNITYGNTQ